MLFTRDIAKQMILRIENGWIETFRKNPPLKKAGLPILVSDKGKKGTKKKVLLGSQSSFASHHGHKQRSFEIPLFNSQDKDCPGWNF